ncbi:CDP-2,3-bis-(O-geranylgeranyl)-sn-glycerol synthase [Methanosalsum natronophilum]|uniref:CDP-archaeol synthase n=1 Tax=Methanosalsum natronophilum TaxID=768733 RepID=A0A3R7X769_9EURY|nr:CDP-2,3-bis-(O-geranylgeranyl)-sn-glycerol synthase [Methanosalsum natronophilum]MCS3924720.1 CDP-2,3-bis-(O-geranylgeranyl)-sn-glycerol synthase [Methanosalsum natronophilum]RQD86740.1 MAG: CDP-2,3-bis-(O-geranylgeranyl)-sn-glycerol synthase [Methanosalsum natronophilum]
MDQILSLVQIAVLAVWLMLPAYFPNPIAAVFGGGKPIDNGKLFFDGRRILGDGKSYRGLLAGITSGLLVGLIQISLASREITILNIDLPSFGPDTVSAILVIFCLSAGSLLGDMVMSFFKRRMNLKRGAPLPLIDQLDFVFGAWILTYLVFPQWFIATFSFNIIIAILIISPILHVTINIIGYIIGVKKEPW